MYKIIDENGVMFLGNYGAEIIPCGKIITKFDIESGKFTEREILGLLKTKRIKKIKEDKKLNLENKK